MGNRQSIDLWYSKSTPGFVEQVCHIFEAEGFEVSQLLEEYIHNAFGYEGIPSIVVEQNQPLFENSVLAFDLYQLIYVSIQFNLLEVIGINKNDSVSHVDEAKEFQSRALFVLSARINHELAAIRLLLFNDLSVQAVGRVRSYMECHEAFMLAAIDAKFAKDFVLSIDAQTTKNLFFKYLSKSKANKKIKSYLASKEGGMDSIIKLEELSKSFINEFGGMVHPSFLPTLEAIFNDMDKLADDDDHKLRRGAVGVMQRTVMLCGGHMIILIFDFYLPLVESIFENPESHMREITKLASTCKTSLASIPLLCARYSIAETIK